MFDTGKTQEDKDIEAKATEHEKINADARAYLSETDWYISRWSETGTDIPEDVTIKREEARKIIL